MLEVSCSPRNKLNPNQEQRLAEQMFGVINPQLQTQERVLVVIVFLVAIHSQNTPVNWVYELAAHDVTE